MFKRYSKNGGETPSFRAWSCPRARGGETTVSPPPSRWYRVGIILTTRTEEISHYQNSAVSVGITERGKVSTGCSARSLLRPSDGTTLQSLAIVSASDTFLDRILGSISSKDIRNNMAERLTRKAL